MRRLDPGAVAALRAAGLLAGDGEGRTTRRWHAAMARAAARLQRAGAPWSDLRVPIAAALLELVPTDDETLVRYVEAMLAAEARGESTATADASPR